MRLNFPSKHRLIDVYSKAETCDRSQEHITGYLPGGDDGQRPRPFSKRTLDPPSVLALLDFFEKLFGLLFVLGIV